MNDSDDLRHEPEEGEMVAVTSVLSLDGVPVRERFDFWWQAVAQSVVSVDAASDQAENYWAEMHMLDLGMAQLSRVRCVSFGARRGIDHIRRSDVGLYQLSLTLSGRSGIEQGGREAALAPADFVLYDTSRAFRAWTVGDAPKCDSSCGIPANVADGIILRFPHEALPLQNSMVAPLLGVRLRGDDGFGALLSGILRQAIRQSTWSPSDLLRLTTIVLDLVSALLAHHIDEDVTAYQNDPQRVLFLRIKAFIEENLADPELSPSTIAAAHHISLRHLHKIFQNADLTVAGWIRERRLERCRRGLTDPMMDRLSIGAIAARWGFPSHAHFTRIFHHTYGTSPSRYRALHRGHGNAAHQRDMR
ncbi:helix-turn-helix domain-containing protein [Nonomuraea sp. NPDC003727]